MSSVNFVNQSLLSCGNLHEDTSAQKRAYRWAWLDTKDSVMSPLQSVLVADGLTYYLDSHRITCLDRVSVTVPLLRFNLGFSSTAFAVSVWTQLRDLLFIVSQSGSNAIFSQGTQTHGGYSVLTPASDGTSKD